MTYELAKQLKDAGYSQELTNGQWAYFTDKYGHTESELHLMHNDNDEGCFCGNDYSHRYFDYGEAHWTKVPTLSELIEACGRGFQRLDRHNLVANPDTFWAFSSKSDDARFGHGDTPEEAVANLYLALNGK